MSFGTRSTSCNGYIARSARSGPGVLVLHDFFGLGASTRSFCDELCREGFTALAPDLYGGNLATTVEDARRMMEGMSGTREKLVVAAEHLRDNWHPRLGIVGFSLGAGLALEHTGTLGAEAVITYYGIGEVDAARWRTPILGHFGASDEWEPLDAVEGLFRALSDAADDVHLEVYEAGHWFANEDVRGAFDARHAASAWASTIDFLHHHLS